MDKPLEAVSGENKETILVIEDEELLQGLVRSMLESNGYDVIIAVNGKEGIAQYRNYFETIILVLLDVGLPDISGQDVLCKLIEVNSDVKIILTSGYPKETVLPGGTIGEKDFLSKPLRMKLLLKKVREVIDG